MALEKKLYTAHAIATGGRDGRAKVIDGSLDLRLTPPKETGGTGEGVNPEQLFAAGYSACFLGAMKFVAKQSGLTLPDDSSITGSVTLGTVPGGFGIAAELKISVPGIDKAQVEDIVAKAHYVCPYSNATRNNIDVTLTVV